MARRPKKPRRKAYQPKPVMWLGEILATRSTMDLQDDNKTDLGAGYWLAFTNLKAGSASEESWSTVVCAVNVGMVLCERVFDKQYEAEFVQALDGLFRAKQRGDVSGAFRLDGDALRAVELALQVHDQQLEQTQRREMIAALREVHRRVDAGSVYR